MGVDYLQIAEAAGLNSAQVDHFLKGVETGQAGRLLLKRGPYDQLQRLVEEIGAQTPLNPSDPHLFYYCTERPLTPLFRPDHPRHKVMMHLLGGAEGKPRACGVWTVAGFDEVNNSLTDEQGSLLVERLKENALWPGGSFAMTRRALKERGSERLPHVNFMAARGTEGRSAVAFHALQGSPSGLSEADGEVLFGDRVQFMIASVRRMLDKNKRHRGVENMLKRLGSIT